VHELGFKNVGFCLFVCLFVNGVSVNILQLDLDYLQSDVEEYMSQNGITDLLSISTTSSSSVTTTSPSSNEFNYSSDNTHSGDNKVKCNEIITYIAVGNHV